MYSLYPKKERFLLLKEPNNFNFNNYLYMKNTNIFLYQRSIIKNIFYSKNIYLFEDININIFYKIG